MALRMLPLGSREEKMTCHVQRRQTIDKPMARHLFLVSRLEARLYEYLLERFRDDGNVEVILDRRRGERRGRSDAQPQRSEAQPPRSDAQRQAERRYSDRRTRREVDLELRVRSHVILTIPEDDPTASLISAPGAARQTPSPLRKLFSS